MGCVQSYFKRAHNAGLSPSSTQDSNSKGAGPDEVASGGGGGGLAGGGGGGGAGEREKSSSSVEVGSERPPEEPESNDTSYGVEATAVRTLAASTGTVAILGTTAKTPQSRRESRVSNVGRDDEGEGVKEERRPSSAADSGKGERATDLDGIAVQIVKDEPRHAKDENHEKGPVPLSKGDDLTANKEEAKESAPVNKVENLETLPKPQAESAEDAETLTPPVKQTTTALVERTKSDEDTDVVALNGPDKEDAALFSEDNDDERPATVLEIEKAASAADGEEKGRNSVSENSGSDDTKEINDISSEQLKTNSLSDTTLSEFNNAELDSGKHSTEEGEMTPLAEQTEPIKTESADKSGVTMENGDNSTTVNGQIEEISTSSNLKSLNAKAEPQVVEEEKIVRSIAKKVESAPPTNIELATTNNDVSSPNVNSKLNEQDSLVFNTEICNDIEILTKENSKSRPESMNKEIKLDNEINKKTEIIENLVTCEKVTLSESVPEIKKEELEKDKEGKKLEEEQAAAAATTIQASFRGYQVRQQQKSGNEEEGGKSVVLTEEKRNSEEKNIVTNGISDHKIVENKLDNNKSSVQDEGKEQKRKEEAAATAIQATFRGYQVRHTIVNTEKDAEKNLVVESIKNDSLDLVTTVEKEDASSEKIKLTDVTKKEEISESTAKDDKNKTILNDVPEIDKKEESKIENKTSTIFESKEDKISSINEKDIDEKEEPTTESSKLKSESKNDRMDPVTGVFITKKEENEIIREKENLPDSAKNEVQFKAEDRTNENKITHNGVPEINKQEELTVESNTGTNVGSKEDNKSSIDEKDIDEKEEQSTGESLIESAATTIQAGFRGFQVRQGMQKKSDEKLENGERIEKASKKEENEKVVDTSVESADNKAVAAATTIQAGFRGFKTRQTMKKTFEDGDKIDSDLDDTVVIEALTPELLESAKESVDEICKRAVEAVSSVENVDDTVITPPLLIASPELVESAKKSVDEICKKAVETTESMIKQDTEATHENASAEFDKEEKPTDSLEEVKETAVRTVQSVVEAAEHIADEKLNSAATTIQASFRGFQARQNLQKMATDQDDDTVERELDGEEKVGNEDEEEDEYEEEEDEDGEESENDDTKALQQLLLGLRNSNYANVKP